MLKQPTLSWKGNKWEWRLSNPWVQLKDWLIDLYKKYMADNCTNETVPETG